MNNYFKTAINRTPTTLIDRIPISFSYHHLRRLQVESWNIFLYTDSWKKGIWSGSTRSKIASVLALWSKRCRISLPPSRCQLQHLLFLQLRGSGAWGRSYLLQQLQRRLWCHKVSGRMMWKKTTLSLTLLRRPRLRKISNFESCCKTLACVAKLHSPDIVWNFLGRFFGGWELFLAFFLLSLWIPSYSYELIIPADGHMVFFNQRPYTRLSRGN